MLTIIFTQARLGVPGSRLCRKMYHSDVSPNAVIIHMCYVSDSQL